MPQATLITLRRHDTEFSFAGEAFLHTGPAHFDARRSSAFRFRCHEQATAALADAPQHTPRHAVITMPITPWYQFTLMPLRQLMPSPAATPRWRSHAVCRFIEL